MFVLDRIWFFYDLIPNSKFLLSLNLSWFYKSVLALSSNSSLAILTYFKTFWNLQDGRSKMADNVQYLTSWLARVYQIWLLFKTDSISSITIGWILSEKYDSPWGYDLGSFALRRFRFYLLDSLLVLTLKHSKTVNPCFCPESHAKTITT